MNGARLRALDIVAEPLAIAAPAEPETAERLTLHDAASALARHASAVILIVMTALVAATVAILLIPPTYRSETKILVRVGREQIAPLELSSTKFSNFVLSQRPETVNDEVELLRQPQLMDSVFGELKLLLAERQSAAAKQDGGPLAATWARAGEVTAKWVEDARGALARTGLVEAMTPDMRLRQRFIDALGISVIKETNVIVLTFSWSDKIFATQAVNAYAEAYRQEHTRLESGIAGMAQLYTQEAARTDKALSQANAELNAFLTDEGIADPGAERQILLGRIQQEEQQISEALVAIEQIGQQIEGYRTQFAKSSDWLETPAIAMTALPGLSDLDAKHADLLVQRDRLLTQFRAGARQVQDLVAQISLLRQTKLQSLVNFLETRQLSERQRVDLVRGHLAQSRARFAQLSTVQEKFKTLQDRRDQLLEQLKTYRSQAEYLTLQETLNAKGLSGVTILGAADLPQSPVAPKKILILGLTLFLASLVASAYALVSERLFSGFRNERQVQAYLGLPTVATVPWVRSQ
jgi:uncharacterized protein involved in exopolysaccharide biosynthesis